MSKPSYGDILAVAKALDDAEVPMENRYMRISKHAFIELGGTEEGWQKILEERAEMDAPKSNVGDK